MENIYVDPEGDRLLEDGGDEFRGVPKTFGEICQFGWCGALDLRVGQTTKPSQIRSSWHRGLKPGDTLLRRFCAHGVCSHGLK